MAKSTESKSAATSGIKLVIVESPTKAKTIRKFLGKDYIVESCMGHVRDLPQSAKDIPEKYKKEAWAKLGVNVDKNFEPLYCIPKDKAKVIKNLREKLAEADSLYLATDEDREGESISWHLSEVLKPKVPTKRMVFHEITKEAIQKSLTETREIDENLVRAQEARRILDRLVGYTISPLLWKKVAYGLSAGRVQSVAVRLIVEREAERIRFKKSLYFGLDGLFSKKDSKAQIESRLLSIGEQRVATGKDFDGITGALTEQAQAKSTLILTDQLSEKLLQEVNKAEFSVNEVEEKPTARKPYPPFITSTLQQESNRKLGLSSRETMQVAQKLYEQGFITYMRTDSTFLSTEAIEAARKQIKSKYGAEYLPAAPRTFEGKKVKGAQEAHEAIRPAGTVFQDPDETGLLGLQLKIYELIWKRTMASQMTDSRQKQVSAKMAAEVMWNNKKTPITFNATGTTIEFPGFLRAYVEGSDDPEGDLEAREIKLPQLIKGEKLNTDKISATSHETKPPARYTEASLVQMMEKEGIGRPSTYASIMGTIVDRGYVRKAGNALIPTFTAMIVSKLLTKHLNLFVDVKFTSKMEKSLDDIAEGDLNWEKYLTTVYLGPAGLQAAVAREGEKIDPVEARQIKLEGLDLFEFHVGRFGAYVKTKQDGVDVSASIPDAEAPADMTVEILEKLIEQKKRGADSLGVDDKTGRKIYVLSGRYGAYVQLGESDEEDVKRTSLPQGMEPTTVNLEMANQLLALPLTLGTHPSLHKDIKAGLGRFGPYVVCDGDYRSIPKTESIFTITFERALEMLSQPKKGRGKAAPLKDYGTHPKIEGLVVQAFNGPYGVYIKAGKTNVGLPEGATLETLTDQQVFDLVTEKVGEGGGSSAKGKAKKAKSAPKAKAAAKPKAAKKMIHPPPPVAEQKKTGFKSHGEKKLKRMSDSNKPPRPAAPKSQLEIGEIRQREPDRNFHRGGRSFYFFDFDDNIAFLTTPLILFHKESGQDLAVSSAEWALHHNTIGKSGIYSEYEIRWDDQTGTFKNFRDLNFSELERLQGRKQPFVQDILLALGIPDLQWKGPSWDCFYHATFNSRPISIITARGHSEEVLRSGIFEFVKSGYLPIEPNYLSLFAVSNKKTRVNLGDSELIMTTAQLKQKAIRASVEKAIEVYGYSPHHRFGMSDDDPKNIQLIVEEMARLKSKYPEMSFFMIETHNGDFIKHEVTQHGLKTPYVHDGSEQLDLFSFLTRPHSTKD